MGMKKLYQLAGIGQFPWTAIHEYEITRAEHFEHIIPYNYTMQWSVLFFDLDDTLYPKTNGLWEAIRLKMTDYLRDPLGFAPDEIQEIRQTYYEKYGTTLRGLQTHHTVDADDYLAYVHDLPLEDFIVPEPELHKMLRSLPQSKWIFTNADADHAEGVLRALAIENCFKGIIDVRALDFLCKPDQKAYQRALELAGDPDPDECVLLDDSIRNLVPAHQAGFTTVLVGSDENIPQVDYAVEKLTDLPQVLPGLWTLAPKAD
jgi:putative hydrolase of the HAD superfamily